MVLNIITILISFIIFNFLLIIVIKRNKLIEIFKKIRNYLRSVWGKQTYRHTKKKSKLDKDVILGKLQILQATDIRLGVKIIGPRGIAHIKEILRHPWVRVRYTNNRISDHDHKKLYQYFFLVYNKRKLITTIYPLSYADYEYIDREQATDTKIETWIEGHITKLGYYQLTKAEKEDREYLTEFNKDGHSQGVLCRLKKRNLLTKINQK